MPGAFEVNAGQFPTNRDGDDLGIGQLCVGGMPPAGDFRRRETAVQAIAQDIDGQKKVFKSDGNHGTISLKLQHGGVSFYCMSLQIG